ncbi:MAG: peptidase MA family metallohydrolase, partial [Thermomicrobiales bacterium]
MIAADIAIRRIAVVLILIGLPAISGAAVGSASQSSVPVTIQSESVVSEFPSGLRFVVSASLSESVDRADVRFTVGANPTFYESTVRFEPTVDPVLELPISFQILGIPPGVEIAYQWRFHTPAGETFASMTFTTEWVDNRFDWAVFEAEDLLVFAYGTDDDLYRYTAQIAQETVERFQAMLDAPERPEPIRIWLYDTQDDLHGSLSPNSREWIGGVSYADFSLIAGVVPAGGDGTMLRVIPHEIVHQILDDATANPFNYPAAWFDEGIAGFCQPVG